MQCLGFVRIIKLMEQTRIDEKIEVLAKFSQGDLTPLLFRYRDRVYKIESVDLKYDLQNGDIISRTFCVTSSGNSYKLSFHNREMNWYLEEVGNV